ncbi:FMN-dependent NADH-azoreductase [Candidatus Rhodobacter oscarellae]|uniref:FMN dependent NADH:quinone oxidoreductase n=1 Tax=Candidatus Rhodobacter oscarellae TaxID=1675527 RepID=A0A0J9ECV6_9RHOB|nr:NAD(P)H-dependent oxidoreductase [Candidatus Rhodobacter lobularis]KMW60516.1 FMN-dependent NADH-azoreductase [Candidatus Rhodobacter lobularis]
MTHAILRIDASARRTGSISRGLLDRLIARYEAEGGAQVTTRDLADALPHIDETWIGANFTPAADRSPEQRARLALSDTLVAELQAADTVLIGLPIYNFGVPASLKAWIDLVARAGLTFRYTPDGPQGLLEGKRAVVAIASGGTEAFSSIDYATTHLKHVLGFLGIHDVQFIRADRAMSDMEATVQSANAAVDALSLAA